MAAPLNGPAGSPSAEPTAVAISERPAPGVNLVGFLEAELGLGEVARKLARGLERAGVPFAPISYRRVASRQEHQLDMPASHEAPYDTNLICLNADYLGPFVADVGVEFFASRYSIGVWFWESSVFGSQSRLGPRYVDEVWVTSDYVREAVSAASDVPVHVVPLPLDEAPAPGRSRADLGLPTDFMFLYVYDFVSAERKNPLGVIEAFKRAFEPGEGCALVLKSINGAERKPRLLEDVQAAAADRPDILVIDRYLAADERNSLMAACDCYVSLHRSEGFGLTMAEAMSYGKPVVATGYSGNLEFMDEANSYLVPYHLAPIRPDWWAYAPGAEWADPDIDAAAALLRRIHDDPREAQARGALAKAQLAERFSLERTAGFITDRLASVRARPSVTMRTPTRDLRVAILRATEELERGVGGSVDETHKRGPVSWVRKLLLRLLWPHLEDQRRSHAAVLDVVALVQRSLDHLEQRLDQLSDSSPTEPGREITRPTEVETEESPSKSLR